MGKSYVHIAPENSRGYHILLCCPSEGLYTLYLYLLKRGVKLFQMWMINPCCIQVGGIAELVLANACEELATQYRSTENLP